MRFPERPRKGDDTHSSALLRLHAARDDYERLCARYAAAEGTSAERAALDRLQMTRAEVAAREAWLVWVERGW
jgi:DNA-binding FadR family transcriptional regulator